MSCYTYRMSQPLTCPPKISNQQAGEIAKNLTLRPIDQADDFHALQPLDPEIRLKWLKL